MEYFMIGFVTGVAVGGTLSISLIIALASKLARYPVVEKKPIKDEEV
ncbi:MAG: hypothetical protein ACD_41C00343G0003 [uncultured bacterium]|nr:MAG: hypothetical protein ACD_41C00343G0003 [uncultured bacterium]